MKLLKRFDKLSFTSNYVIICFIRQFRKWMARFQFDFDGKAVFNNEVLHFLKIIIHFILSK